MIVSFYKALPWTMDRRRQGIEHEIVGLNPTEVQKVEHAAGWSDEAGDYWCSAITLRRSHKDELPLVVVGKPSEVIKKLNEVPA